VDTLGLLLLPAAKKSGPIDVGNALEGFSIVVDDAAKDLPALVAEKMAVARQQHTGGGREAGDTCAVVRSPDGYPFTLLPYSQFSKYKRNVM
jgi:hypothetical protein